MFPIISPRTPCHQNFASLLLQETPHPTLHLAAGGKTPCLLDLALFLPFLPLFSGTFSTFLADTSRVPSKDVVFFVVLRGFVDRTEMAKGQIIQK